MVNELRHIGMNNAEGLFLNDIWKEEIFDHLKLLMEQERLSILGDDAQLISQINEQRCEYLEPKTAQERVHLRFWHPRGRHDDQLVALALACHASKQQEGLLLL